MMNSFVNFEGKTCLVTGAGSPTGIGFATAKILAGLGANIALIATTDRIYDRASELASEGIKAKGYIADLMDREQVETVIADIISDFGPIQVLVNNAGMVQVGGEEDFSEMKDITYEEASYITGESLVVDGGNTIQEYKGPSELYY